MRTYKDQGLIIRTKNLKEADRYYVILGEKVSRIEAVAHGAGKILSKKGSVLDLFNYCKFSFYKTKGLDLLLEAELIDNFEDLKLNLQNISEIFYLAEILNKLLIDAVEDKSYLSFIIDLLYKIRSYPDKINLLIVSFELQLLSETGFLPELSNCILCQDKLVENTSRIAASGGEAGYLCSKHFDIMSKSERLVPDKVIKLQKYLLKSSLENQLNLKHDEELLIRTRDIQKNWLEGILENRLKSISFLNIIRKENYEEK